MGRSAALVASPGRVTSGAPRGIPLRPQAEPRAASARRPVTASATPRPRRPTPRADWRRCSPRPPPGALPAAIGIYAAWHVRRAAARLAATTSRATSRVGASARDRICAAAAEARAAARRLAPLLTTAAAGGAPGGYRHLRRVARPTRRGTPSCDSLTLHQPRRSVGPWPHLRRRSRGARGRSRIVATDHHGRLRGRSAALAASPAHAAPNTPRHALLRPHGDPPAAAERRPAAAPATPHPRPRADRCRCSPRPPPGAIRGSIRIYGVRRVQRAASRRGAAAWPAVSAGRPSLAAARATPQPSRARIGATTHHGHVQGRFRALSASTPRGASNALRHAVLRLPRAPPVATEGWPQSAHNQAAQEARRSTSRSMAK